jgi:hypothetical protein
VPNEDWPEPPGRDASELQFILFEQDGVATFDQLCSELKPSTIRSRVNTGRWQTASHGIYVTHNGPMTYRQRHWAAVLAAGNGHAYPLAGLSALESHGLRGSGRWVIDVLVPSGAIPRALPSRVIVHRTSLLLTEHTMPGSPPRTSPARALVDAAAWSPSDEGARALVASVFQQRLVTIDEVLTVIGQMRRSRRRALVLETALDCAGGSHSVSELDFLKLCRDNGLPTPTRQVSRFDFSGRQRFLDAVFEEYKLMAEIDGGHHMDPRSWWDDMKRQNDVWIDGMTILRFPSWAIRAEPDQVVAQIRRALVAAGWTGVSGS